MLRVSLAQAINYRLAVNHLATRLPAGAYVEAAHAGLQDTAPRDALIGLHARVTACEPDAWADPRLFQTYSPRAAVYVLPAADFGVFTIGRLPRDPDAQQRIEERAEDACRLLNGQELLATGLPIDRAVCASGRIAIRWTTTAVYLREIPCPPIDPEAARLELCRRHVHAFGPTTAAAFAWWSGVSARDAKTTFELIADEFTPVDLDGVRAWIRSDDEALLRSAEPMRGVRLLVASDLRLFGQDRAGLFVGPGQVKHSPLQGWHHPNGLMVDGRIVGAWGRKQGRVTIKTHEAVPRDAVHEEVARMPIPNAEMSVRIEED
jgi:hypothetical protein